MFRAPGLFRLGSPLAFTGNVRTSLKPTASFFRTYRSLTWRNYNRHFQQKIDWKLLAKPALFTAAFCIGTTVAVPALFKMPPFSTLLRHPNSIIYGIIALNIGGFLAWRMPASYNVMARYGLLLKNRVTTPWTLLGLAFSHKEGLHLAFNMLMLWSFGTTVCSYIGAGNFVTMYLNSAVISSFFSLAIPTILRLPMTVASLGASGAIISLFGTFCYLFPRASIGFFFIPIPGGAWMVFLATVAFNAAGVVMKWGRYDYAAHLGGCIAGVAYGWWYDRIRRTRVRRRV